MAHKVATAQHFADWREMFRGYTDEQLAFVRKDCLEAGLAQPDDAGFYADQASVAIQEQNRRALAPRARATGKARRRAYLNR